MTKEGYAVTSTKGYSNCSFIHEKKLVNVQKPLLQERFDFGRESLLAERLVAGFNTRIETFEDQTGIQRVHPGEGGAGLLPWRKGNPALFDT